MAYGENLNFPENFTFPGKVIKPVYEAIYFPEMRIPLKCDFQGKFEFPGKTGISGKCFTG